MKSVNDWIQQSLSAPKDFTWDGQIVSVFESYIHVRLEGGNRRLVTNVIIADHIDRDKLKPGRYCKISRLHDRGEGQTSRFILTDILPVPEYDGVNIQTSAKPLIPRMSVTLDCTDTAWYLSWNETENALSYIVYKAQDENGLSSTQLVETTNLDYSLPFVVDGFAFFAVEAVGTAGNSGLSEWTTDNRYFQDTGIIAFGDDVIHGDVISGAIRFKITANGVFRSENHGVSWPFEITPTSVFDEGFGETIPLSEMEWTQIITFPNVQILFGKWQNTSNLYRGWFWVSTNLGETWTSYSLRNGSGFVTNEWFPIWGYLGSDYLYVTQFIGGELNARAYEVIDFSTLYDSLPLGVVTRSQVENKEWWAFPAGVENSVDEVYLSGRFTI